MRIAFSASERRAARSLGAAALLAVAMLFCGIAHRFGTPDAELVSAIAIPGLTFGWIAYLVTFWRHIHVHPADVDAGRDTELAA